MRRSHLLLAGLGVTAVAVTGSAFTAANTVPASVAGYGQGAVTGAVVSDVDYTPQSGNNTNLDTVTFNSNTNVNGKTASLTLKQGTTVIGTFTCDTTTSIHNGTTMDITCPTSPTFPAFDSFNFVGLTVLD
jgi:hypothetical protein